MTPILNHYFARINWSGAAAVNIDTLRALHLKHNCTIPFRKPRRFAAKGNTA